MEKEKSLVEVKKGLRNIIKNVVEVLKSKVNKNYIK